MYKLHTHCRACHSTGLTSVVNLGLQPLANEFVLPYEEHSGYAPLEVLYCNKCTLAQLSVVVDPKILYSNYRYVTSQSDMMFNHFDLVSSDLLKETDGRSIVEIGSNDGQFLLHMLRRGFGPVAGIDAAANLAEIAWSKGISTVPRQFDSGAAALVRQFVSKVDIVVARHVFCHADDWSGFIAALNILCHKDSVVCIEVPSTEDMLDRSEWDTIYHEHLSYLTVKSMMALLEYTGWHLHRVIHYPIHGGSLMLMLRKDSFSTQCHVSVSQFNEHEYVNAERWTDLSDKAQQNRAKLRALVSELVNKGKIVCGYGASAKSTGWVNACWFNEKHISFITDTTPQKIGRFSPGTKIPIVSEECLTTLKPDYAIMFCWNYRESVLNKNEAYLKAGGHFIIPVPEIEIV